jgi:molybdopterin synthase sulfur carrier subunit
MKVTIKYFARLREIVGKEHEVLDIAGSDGTLGGLLEDLGDGEGPLGDFLSDRPVLLAVNGEYADRGTTLQEGDEVALFPPVSGG